MFEILFIAAVGAVALFLIVRDERAAARRGPPPRVLPWYELVGDQIAIRPYPSSELATKDANLAATFGWSVQSISTSEGHVNLGRTVTGAVLTGGIALLAGGSRTQGSVTVTFTRATVAVAA